MRYVNAITIIAGLIVSSTGYAQNDDLVVEEGFQSSQSYPAVEQAPAVDSSRNVLIINRNSNNSSAQLQQQPTINVEATPLTDSRASQLRRARQDAEVQTEQKIVEKLETSRLEDERRRAENLIGNRLDSHQPAVQAAPAPVIVQHPEPSVSKEEIIQAIKEEVVIEKIKDKREENRTFAAGSLGLLEYDNAINVQANYSAGFSIGMVMADSNIVVDGSFVYSNLYIHPSFWGYHPVYDELDQYNFQGAVKFSPKLGVFSPFVGAVAGYTYRNYTEKSMYADGYYGGYPTPIGHYPETESSTNAIDIGFVTGVDVYVSDNFVVGGEYKYMTNLTTWSSSQFLDSYYMHYGPGRALEEFDYYSIGVTAKMMF